MTVRHIGNSFYYALSSDTKPLTANNGSVLFETDTRKIYFFNGSLWQEQDAVPPGSGEVNTASNVGVGGIGVFKQKTGVNLEFKNLIEGSSSTITLSDDTDDNEIEIDIDTANILLSNLGGTLTAGQLPTGTLINTADNDLGDHYLDIGDIAVPANPASGIRRIFTNTSTGELCVRTNAGTTVSLEASAAGEANTASNVGTAGVGLFKQKTLEDLEFKKINAGSSKITITDDIGNNEVDIDIGSGIIGDSEIATHTTTKITTTDKALLNTAIMYEDEDNNIGAHYFNIAELAAPTQPATDNARLYLDSTTGRLSIKKDNDIVKDLEIKQYPFMWISYVQGSSANWANGIQNPLTTNTRYNGENNVNYIVSQNTIVITRVYLNVINNSKDGTSTMSLLDDGSAVPNTTLNIAGLTNARVDSGPISQSIVTGSKISIKTDTSASTTGMWTYAVEIHGYYELT